MIIECRHCHIRFLQASTNQRVCGTKCPKLQERKKTHAMEMKKKRLGDIPNVRKIGDSFYHYSEDSKMWGKYMSVSPQFDTVPELVRWDKEQEK